MCKTRKFTVAKSLEEQICVFIKKLVQHSHMVMGLIKFLI